MVTRIASAVVLIVAALVCLGASVWSRAASIVLVAGLSVKEMISAIKHAGYKVTYWQGYACCALTAVFYDRAGLLAAFQFAIVLTVILSFCVRVFSKKDRTLDHLASLSVIIYPLSLLVFVLAAALEKSPLWQCVLITGIGAACVTDIFALFGGMLWGKHKLSPELSPKKTIEGAICGFVFGTAFGVAVYYLQTLWGAAISVWVYLFASACCAIAGQIGDLAASSIKRAADIKDFGKIIPGHGGILDRIDSILFALPIAYIFMRLTV